MSRIKTTYRIDETRNGGKSEGKTVDEIGIEGKTIYVCM